MNKGKEDKNVKKAP